jgi:hypothetical protein
VENTAAYQTGQTPTIQIAGFHVDNQEIEGLSAQNTQGLLCRVCDSELIVTQVEQFRPNGMERFGMTVDHQNRSG